MTEVVGIVDASLPARSWIAFASLPPDGSVYATVTVSVLTTEDNKPSRTDVPEAETEASVREEPFTRTVNALAADVDGDIASENVNEIVVPAAFTAAELNVGAVVSTGPEIPSTDLADDQFDPVD